MALRVTCSRLVLDIKVAKIVSQDPWICIISLRLRTVAVLDGPRGLGWSLFRFTVQFALDFAEKRRPALLDIVTDDGEII